MGQVARRDWLHIGDLRIMQGVAILGIGLPAAWLIASTYSPEAFLRYLTGFGGAIVIQIIFTEAMVRRIGQERSSLADLLTCGRATLAGLGTGIVMSGIPDHLGPAGLMVLIATVVGASVSDWLDGPLARHAGPTKIGAVLDIESDSWLTCWSASVAVFLGGLPWFCMIAPLLHYLHLIRDLRAGRLPQGGGPWWSRVTGVAQMSLIVLALWPWEGDLRDAILMFAAYPVSAAQTLVMLVSLRANRRLMVA